MCCINIEAAEEAAMACEVCLNEERSSARGEESGVVGGLRNREQWKWNQPYRNALVVSRELVLAYCCCYVRLDGATQLRQRPTEMVLRSFIALKAKSFHELELAMTLKYATNTY